MKNANREKMTCDDAKRRILRRFEIMRRDYDELWRRYREVVHENVELAAENDRLRNHSDEVVV